jgi:hypothetical protein
MVSGAGVRRVPNGCCGTRAQRYSVLLRRLGFDGLTLREPNDRRWLISRLARPSVAQSDTLESPYTFRYHQELANYTMLTRRQPLSVGSSFVFARPQESSLP